MKRFHIINLILIMALSILCFFNTALYVVIWIVWIFAYIGAAIYFNAAMHRKLYDYKVAQGWLVEGQKKKVYIDTAVLTMTEKSAVPYRYHAVVILIEILCVLPFCVENVRFFGKKWGYSVSVPWRYGNGVDSACFYQPQTAYGLQSGYAEKPAGQLPDKKIYRGSTSCHEQL